MVEVVLAEEDDICIYGGGGCYRTARARDEQSGAVAERAHLEWPAYQRAARELDTRFHHPRTPVYDRLLSFGQVRCLVFRSYGEGSPDVHNFLRAAAQQRATLSWRRQGARTQSEAYGIYLSTDVQAGHGSGGRAGAREASAQTRSAHRS